MEIINEISMIFVVFLILRLNFKSVNFAVVIIKVVQVEGGALIVL